MRKVIAWGLDSVSRKEAESFLAFLRQTKHAGSRCFPFAPVSSDPLEELRHQLHTLQKQRANDPASASGELALALLVSPGAPDAVQSLELLPAAAQVLRDVIAGSCPLILALLLPAGLASREEKIRVFRFFLELEARLGTFAGLESILVHEADSVEVDSPGDGNEGSPECFEMLYRELLDDSLGDVVRCTGSHAVGSQLQVSGRRACYSTGGARRFLYDARGTHRYLAARFQVLLYKKGLLNVAALARSRKDLAAIHARADRFAEQACRELQPPPLPPPWGTPQMLRAQVLREKFFETATLLKTAAGRLIQCVKGSFHDSGGELLCPGCDQQLCTLRGKIEAGWGKRVTKLVKEEFHEALATLPGRLAGGKLHLQALLGNDLLSRLTRDPPRLTGFKLFQKMFCQDPLLADLDGFCQARLAELPEEFQFLSKDPLQEILREEGYSPRVLQVLHLAEGPGLEPVDACIPFLKSIVMAVCAHARNEFLGLNEVGVLLDKLMGLLAAEARRFDAEMEELEKAIERLQEELEELRRSTPWIFRVLLGRGAYLRERERIKGEIRELELRRAWIRETFRIMLDYSIALLDLVIWPHCIRAGINQLLKETLEAESRQFHAFLAQVEEALRKEWKESWPVNRSGGMDVDVLSRPRLKKLCERGARGMTPEEAVEALLAHLSPKGWDGRQLSRSYADCRNLKDHYLAGPETLLQRLEDYARMLFYGVLELTVVDILELDGASGALRFLEYHLAGAGPHRFFSSVLLPQVLAKGGMQRALVARTGNKPAAQLQPREYAALLEKFSGAEPQFVDNDDSTTLDLTWFAFGFPAYLIHAMEEYRRLFRDQEGDAAGDLWPVS